MKYLLTLVFFFSCSYDYGQRSFPKDHYVILPFNKDGYAPLPKNSVPATLNDSDFERIDRILSICIDKYNRSQIVEYKKMTKKFPNLGFRLKDFVIDLKRYYRQYIVVKNANGEKEVWVNCFCNIQNMEYWKKQVVFVDDGGNCFFNVRINLTKETFADFIVNGVA
jgi:hypothetical protein